MSININNPTEINVVNVGDEISTNQLAAITGAALPSASNVFATMADVGNEGYLPLTGGTMTGNINFGTGGQNIAEGSFDNGLGGYNGISLNCAVGYELNWQAGYLTVSDGTNLRPLNLIDWSALSPSGGGFNVTSGYNSSVRSTLHYWGLLIDDGAGQTVNFNSQTLSFSDSNTGGSININNYWTGGFEHVSFAGTSRLSSFGLECYSGTDNSAFNVNGITFADGSFQSTAASSSYTVQDYTLASPSGPSSHTVTGAGEYVVFETIGSGISVNFDNLPVGASCIVTNLPTSTDSVEFYSSAYFQFIPIGPYSVNSISGDYYISAGQTVVFTRLANGFVFANFGPLTVETSL